MSVEPQALDQHPGLWAVRAGPGSSCGLAAR